MPNSAPSPAKRKGRRKVPLRLRISLALAVWLVLSMVTPVLAQSTAWRWTLVTAFGGIAVILGYRMTAPPLQAKPRLPKIQAPPGVLEDLTTRALERADRTMAAWLTIIGAAHSAFFAAISRARFPFLVGDNNVSIAAVCFIVLGAITFTGHHAITNTRTQASRALALADRAPVTGQFFKYVYADQEEGLLAGLFVPLIKSFGMIWMYIGFAFAAIMYIVQIL